MASILKSTKNTRFLQEGNLRYIRSDVIESLSEEEIQWLLQNHVDTVVDLRTREEAEKRPCCLQNQEGFHYHLLSVTGGNTIPEDTSKVADSYIKMLDDTMKNIISLIEHAQNNVIYFCNAGKDRTGVVSALLLTRLGAGRKEVIEDYTRTYENLKEMIEKFSRENPTIDSEIITPKAIYMERFLDYIEQVGFSC